jgi:hypothetical protein
MDPDANGSLATSALTKALFLIRIRKQQHSLLTLYMDKIRFNESHMEGEENDSRVSERHILFDELVGLTQHIL